MKTNMIKDTETIIENNLELLQDIHAQNYNGTNDAMLDNFETWISGFGYDELELLVSKIPNWLDDSILDTIDEIKDRENEAPLQKLKRLTNYD
jgi:hypothetical protein